MALTRVSLPSVSADDAAMWSAPSHTSLHCVADVIRRLYDARQTHGWIVAQEALMIIERLMERPLWVNVTDAPPFMLQAIDVLTRLGLVRGFRDHDDPRHPHFNERMYVLTACDGHDFATHLYPILGYVTAQLSSISPTYAPHVLQRLIANRVLEYVDRYVFSVSDFHASPVSNVSTGMRRAAGDLGFFDSAQKDDDEEPVN